MGLAQRYDAELERAGWQRDPEQERALAYLQRIHDELTHPAPSFWGRLLGAKPQGKGVQGKGVQGVRGLYLWGGVGRGKTYLMDLFFNTLALEQKRRLHFYRFMQAIHNELKTLRDRQDPLALLAARWAAQTRLICLDELFVSDITDAMLLAGLLRALFGQGVTLVTTSNSAPDELYQGGLQRARFVPAIELIKTRLDVVHLGGATDYRLRYLERAEIFHHPLDDQAEVLLAQAFAAINQAPGETAATLGIAGRPILTRRLGQGVVWFDFGALCDGPRGQADYIEIARYFHTVLISAIPILDRTLEDPARRFLNLIDEFYDRNVTLIASAAAPITALYRGEKLRFDYQRTVSRLQEMQSYAYLARAHLP